MYRNAELWDGHTSSAGFAGSVSTGFIHATPGEMKSLRSSAEIIALIISTLSGCFQITIGFQGVKCSPLLETSRRLCKINLRKMVSARCIE